MPAKKPDQPKDLKCAKCGAAMADGCLVRPWAGTAGGPVQLWAPGRGQTPADFGLGGKKQGRSLSVQTWRCKTCGYLESYAR